MVYTPSSASHFSDAASASTSTPTSTPSSTAQTEPTTSSYKTYTPFPNTFRPVPRSNDSPNAYVHLKDTIPQLIACATPSPLDKDTTVDTTQAKVQPKVREVAEIVLTGKVRSHQLSCLPLYSMFGANLTGLFRCGGAVDS